MKKISESIQNSVAQNLRELLWVKKYLYENPEVGGTEEKACAVLIQKAKEHDFIVEENYCGVPHAFRAVYDTGVPGPTVGYCAEYDALPEIGHGCGHNMIAAISLGAAIALRDAAPCGRVVLFGTPAEENFVRKRDLAAAGAFAGIDACLMVHPSQENAASMKTTAIDAYQVDFTGRAAHAGDEPEKGINALDAAVDFYTMIREKTPADVNIHGIIKEGGIKTSIIPERASLQYFCRAFSQKSLEETAALFETCARTAAETYGAGYRIFNFEPSNLDMVPNETISAVFNEAYANAGGGPMPKPEKSGGSTDMGDVSHVCPAIHSWVGLDCRGINMHSREFAEITMTEKADRVTGMAAEALAETGIQILTNAALLAKIKEEFQNNPETDAM